MIGRRTLCAAGASGWLGVPLPATAQARRPGKMAKVGVMVSGSASVPDPLHPVFLAAMRELGWEDGRNVEYVVRYAGGVEERFRAAAAELLEHKVDIIFASFGPAARVAAQVAPTLPIVFALHSDPVRDGTVASLVRPGGNVTGFSTANRDLGGKRVDLLREIRPGLRRLANLGDVPPGGNAAASNGPVAQAARAAGLEFQHFGVERADAIAATFDELQRWRADAVVVSATPVLVARKREVMEHAARLRLPMIYARADIVAEGGLMSYSADFADNYRKAAGYVDRILKGAKPAELPVQQPTKFYLVVNLKTAKALGIVLPRELLLRVDELIQQ